MRGVALILVVFAAPAIAAEHSPWVIDTQPPPLTEFRELAQQQQAPNGQACCKHCTKGQPCGNTCISATAKCKSPPGCAC